MKRKINIIEGAMKYKQIIIAFTFVMMVLGILGLINMPRREFPEFVIRQGVIVGIYPGATSEEIEEQLTTVVENYIYGYEEVNKEKTVSNSSEGRMVIYVELNDNIVDADSFWSKLRHGLDELKQQKLPTGVLALIGNNDFGDVSSMLITMSSEKKSFRRFVPNSVCTYLLFATLETVEISKPVTSAISFRIIGRSWVSSPDKKYAL